MPSHFGVYPAGTSTSFSNRSIASATKPPWSRPTMSQRTVSRRRLPADVVAARNLRLHQPPVVVRRLASRDSGAQACHQREQQDQRQHELSTRSHTGVQVQERCLNAIVEDAGAAHVLHLVVLDRRRLFRRLSHHELAHLAAARAVASLRSG